MVITYNISMDIFLIGENTVLHTRSKYNSIKRCPVKNQQELS